MLQVPQILKVRLKKKKKKKKKKFEIDIGAPHRMQYDCQYSFRKVTWIEFH